MRPFFCPLREGRVWRQYLHNTCSVEEILAVHRHQPSRQKLWQGKNADGKSNYFPRGDNNPIISKSFDWLLEWRSLTMKRKLMISSPTAPPPPPPHQREIKHILAMLAFRSHDWIWPASFTHFQRPLYAGSRCWPMEASRWKEMVTQTRHVTSLLPWAIFFPLKWWSSSEHGRVWHN